MSIAGWFGSKRNEASRNRGRGIGKLSCARVEGCIHTQEVQGFTVRLVPLGFLLCDVPFFVPDNLTLQLLWLPSFVVSSYFYLPLVRSTTLQIPQLSDKLSDLMFFLS